MEHASPCYTSEAHFLLRAAAFTVPGPNCPGEVNYMKAYEVMLLIDPSLDEEAYAAVIEKASGVITSQGGVVDSSEDWGKRRLAYEIKGLTDGAYTVLHFHAAPEAVAELDRVLHITDPVARFMIVRRDDID